MLKSIALAACAAFAVAGGAAAQTCATYPNTLTNGTTADANQVMANFNCAALVGAGNFTAPVQLGTSTEKLSLNSGSIGFNRRVQDGYIYNSGAYAYQWQHVGSTTPSSDYLALYIYYPTGGLFSGGALAVNGAGGVSIGGGPQPGWLFTSNGQAGGVYGWATISDSRLKQDVTPITDALTLVQQLQGVRYHWRAPADRSVGKTLNLAASNQPQIGFLAQDVAKVVPEAVVAPGAGPDAVYGIMDTKLIPILVEAVKAQQAEIVALQADIAALKAGK